MSFEAWASVVIFTLWLSLLVYVLTGLRGEEEMSTRPARPGKCDRPCCRAWTTITALGATLMSALDDALARVTTFVKDVVAQLTAAKTTNDTQTGKLAELQAALDVALSDDAADKAAIAALQAEISTLQDSVAAQINAAVDALQAVPAPVEEAVAAEAEVAVVEPVSEVTEPAVDETKGEVVE